MRLETVRFWRPKIYQRQEWEAPPTLEEIESCLRDVKPAVSASTYQYLLARAHMPPDERIAVAFTTVIDLLRRDTRRMELRDNTEILARVMTAEEYASFYEISITTALPYGAKYTAEKLMCLYERGALAFFLSSMFVDLPQDHLRPLDGEE